MMSASHVAREAASRLIASPVQCDDSIQAGARSPLRTDRPEFRPDSNHGPCRMRVHRYTPFGMIIHVGRRPAAGPPRRPIAARHALQPRAALGVSPVETGSRAGDAGHSAAEEAARARTGL